MVASRYLNHMNIIKYTAVLFLAASTTLTAQNSKVTSAWRYMEINELDNAKEAIDMAAKHEKTGQKADTWMLRGKIYYNIYAGEDEEMKKQFTGLLEGAAESFLKVKELDSKGSYTAEVMRYLSPIRGQFINEGGADYGKKDFESALKKFEMSSSISAAAFEKDTMYWMAVNNAALANENLKNYDAAIAGYESLIADNYETKVALSSIMNIHDKKGDKEKVYEMAKRGRELFPNDIAYILQELQYLLDTKQDAKAEENLKVAIEQEPKNPKLRFALGVVYNNLANPETGTVEEVKYKDYLAKGEAAYLKALELDPKYGDAAHNLGALQFNAGVRYVEQAKDAKSDDANAKLMAKADEYFKQSLPQLEKANELNPGDREILMSLRDLYLKMGDGDKYMEYKTQVDSLSK